MKTENPNLSSFFFPANSNLTALTIDRLWAVSKPHCYRQRATSRRATLIMLPLILFAFLSNGPAMIMMEQKGGVCLASDSSNKFIPRAALEAYIQIFPPAMDLLFFGIILVCNILIIRGLRNPKEGLGRHEKDAAIALLLVTTLFLVVVGSLGVTFGAVGKYEGGSEFNTQMRKLLTLIAVS